MADEVTRREALRLGALGVGALALGRVPLAVAASGRATLSSELAAAATGFLDSLGDAARGKATYAFGDAERFRWHWTIPETVPRNGLPLRELTAGQRRLALALLRASSSAAGYRKSMDIVRLQGVLRQEVGTAASSFDPERYYVTVFGTPGGKGPWGWRFEGHHLSRHFTVAGDRVSAYPYFLGAWPTRVSDPYGGLPRGYRTMPREEDAARTLVRSLPKRQQQVAIFGRESLTDHVTQNAARVRPLDPVGVRVDDLAAAQRRLVRELVDTYAAVLPAEVASRALARIDRAGFGKLRFGWTGALVPHEPQYWRLQGPTFLLEFDNSRNDGTHIHSVWRDFAEDFGRDLL